MDDSVDLLRFEIKNVNPVTAEAYSQALMAVADEYEQFMALHVSKSEKAAIKMNMASIRDGSLISDIAPYLAGTPPLLEVLKGVADYATYLRALFDWMLSKGERPEIADERKTLKNISSIVKPTVHDSGAQMNIGVDQRRDIQHKCLFERSSGQISAGVRQDKARVHQCCYPGHSP